MSNLFPTLTTERLILRPLEPKDATPRYQAWLNDPQINTYLESRFVKQSLEEMRKYIEAIQKSNKHLFLAITIRETGEHVGNIKLGPIDNNHKLGDIGILIGEKDWWGKGIASEAIKEITRYAFEELKLHKITAGCYSDNEGSAVAFEKAGFKREALRPQHFFSQGRFVDYILLGLINPNFKN